MSLLEDLRLAREDAGRFSAHLEERWCFFKPSGGVLMSLALEAMRQVLGEAKQEVVSATTVFCTPVDAGRLEIEVEVLRAGTAASQLRASVRSDPTRRGLELIATFACDREGYPDVVEANMPDVPPPDALQPALPNPRHRMPFFENFEQRLAYGHFSWEPGDWTPGPARYARWIRYLEPPMRAGRIDPLAFPPIIDLMPPALVHKVGKEQAQFFAPSLDLTVHFYGSTEEEWFLVSGLCRRARGGTASAEVELFTRSGSLVAYGTQVMILKRY